jgi:hypothetical protein
VSISRYSCRGSKNRKNNCGLPIVSHRHPLSIAGRTTDSVDYQRSPIFIMNILATTSSQSRPQPAANPATTTTPAGSTRSTISSQVTWETRQIQTDRLYSRGVPWINTIIATWKALSSETLIRSSTDTRHGIKALALLRYLWLISSGSGSLINVRIS